MVLPAQEAVRGTRRRLDLRQLGITTPMEVDIPAGIENGHTLQLAAPLPGGRGRARILAQVQVGGAAWHAACGCCQQRWMPLSACPQCQQGLGACKACAARS